MREKMGRLGTYSGAAIRRRMLTSLVLVVVAAVGCTPYATYAPLEGAAGSNPSTAPIPELMAEALLCAWDMDGAPGELVINLPEGTRGLVYDMVIKKMGGGRPMMVAGERAYAVVAVRVRATAAEVDVIRPAVGAGRQPKLLTVYFEQHLLEGYQVARSRDWNFPVEAFPPPTYVPEPPRPGAKPPRGGAAPARAVVEPDPETPSE